MQSITQVFIFLIRLRLIFLSKSYTFLKNLYHDIDLVTAFMICAKLKGSCYNLSQSEYSQSGLDQEEKVMGAAGLVVLKEENNGSCC